MNKRRAARPWAWATDATALVDESLDNGSFAVTMPTEGYKAWTRIYLAEHVRRQSIGLGAVTSTALLSSLWELPSGGSVPTHSLSDTVVAQLRSTGCVATESADGFTRTYAPIGTVDAVAFAGNRPGDVVRRAASFSPIVRRYAIVRARQASAELIECSQHYGVGLIIVHDDEALVIVEPSPPETGRPHVYRWWLAELAYAHIELGVHPALQL